jgi:uncharacterized protein
MGARLLLAVAALAAAAPAAAQRAVPRLTGPVVDEAGLLDAGARRRLEALSRAAWAQPEGRRVQLQVLIVGSLEGDSIEDLASRAFEAWGLGEKGRDNGVLILVARDDRRVRIETGYGTEGALTDAQAGRIIRNVIQPAFREGRYGDGLYAAGVQVLSALGALPEGTAAPAARPGGGIHLSALAIVLLGMAIVAFRILSFVGPRRRRFWYGGWGGGLGGGWGGGLGGGGGWGGGGGGGWSGGGGGSGGGGASGSW